MNYKNCRNRCFFEVAKLLNRKYFSNYLSIEECFNILPETGLSGLYNLIDLYEAWSKPEKAKEWRAKLSQTEAWDE